MQEVAGIELPGFDGATSFVDLIGNSQINLDAFAELNIDVGIDFSDTDNLRYFVHDYDGAGDDFWNSRRAGARAHGRDMELEFQFGPTSVGIQNGWLALDGDGNINTEDYATFTLRWISKQEIRKMMVDSISVKKILLRQLLGRADR